MTDITANGKYPDVQTLSARRGICSLSLPLSLPFAVVRHSEFISESAVLSSNGKKNSNGKQQILKETLKQVQGDALRQFWVTLCISFG
jgi:hypothetical protein